MTTADQLQQKLVNVFSGHPWYGTPINDIISNVTFETAYEKPPGGAHCIVEIILHMLNWTEEVTERMKGKPASLPSKGDWPHPGEPDEQKWGQLVNYLKLANVQFIKEMQDLPADKWERPISDQGGDEPVTTYTELVDGFIQHQIYHAGQIAILNRIING